MYVAVIFILFELNLIEPILPYHHQYFLILLAKCYIVYGSLSPSNLCIIALNSPKSISPLPSSSTSLIMVSQTSSSIYLPTPKTSLSSSTDIEPLPSLSQNPNAYYNFSSLNSLPLLTVAVTNSWKSISPLWSTSTNLNILLVSVMAIAGPQYFVKPVKTSSYCNFPSPF